MFRLLFVTLLIASSALAQGVHSVSLRSVSPNQAQAPAPTGGCSANATFDPTLPGQLTLCDPVPPGPACILSIAGASTLCRINGTINLSENGAPFHPLYVAPVEVFRFYAPTNLVIGPSTAIYIGTLIAGGHNPDMVYLALNACTLTKVVYDTRTNGAVTTPVTMSLWDVTQNVAIPNAATTQTWNGWVQETVAAPTFAVAANDQLQVRFSTPKTLPPGFYLNLTVTAYCTDN